MNSNFSENEFNNLDSAYIKTTSLLKELLVTQLAYDLNGTIFFKNLLKSIFLKFKKKFHICLFFLKISVL